MLYVVVVVCACVCVSDTRRYCIKMAKQRIVQRHVIVQGRSFTDAKDLREIQHRVNPNRSVKCRGRLKSASLTDNLLYSAFKKL